MTNIIDEYRTIGDGALWRERREHGRLRIDGADRTAFLQALVSNDVAALLADTGLYATYLTPQGRMLADLHLFNRGDALLAVVPAELTASLASRFDGLIFSEDVRVTDVSDEIAQILVVGARASTAIAAAIGADAAALDALQPLAQLTVAGGFVARSDDVSVPAFDLFVPAATRDDVTGALERAGARAASRDLVEALRIDAARPAFGPDMTSETIPLEAGLLERAISTTKGCYVGQELIIRVLHRGGGRVARRLVQLVLDEPSAVPPVGAGILVGGEERGHLTSVAFSPRLGRPIALGYVARAEAEPGTRVMLAFQGLSLPAEITALAG
jgi:folate-binding protein YgfZ